MTEITIAENIEEGIYVMYDSDSDKLIFRARYDLNRTTRFYSITLNDFMDKIKNVPKKKFLDKFKKKRI
jgi:hypothetical protein